MRLVIYSEFMKSSLETKKKEIVSLYAKGYGCPEIVSILGLEITPRSMQRFLKAKGIVRTVEEALELSEPRRIATIQASWANHAKAKRRILNPKRRYEIFKRDGFKCQKCGRGVNEGVRLEVDHIIPIDDPKCSNDNNNLQTLCSDCNVGKYNVEHPVYRSNNKK